MRHPIQEVNEGAEVILRPAAKDLVQGYGIRVCRAVRSRWFDNALLLLQDAPGLKPIKISLRLGSV